MHRNSKLYISDPINITEVQRIIHSELSNRVFAKQALKFLKLTKRLPETIDAAFEASDFTPHLEEIKNNRLSNKDVKKELFKINIQKIMDDTIGTYLNSDIQDSLKLWLCRQYNQCLSTKDRTYDSYRQLLKDFKSACLMSGEEGPAYNGVESFASRHP